MAAAMEAAPHPDFALSPRHVGCRWSVEERETLGSATSGSPPILFALAPHCRRVRVFHLEPVARPAARVSRAAPLADNPLTAELARVHEHDRARIVKHRIEH